MLMSFLILSFMHFSCYRLRSQNIVAAVTKINEERLKSVLLSVVQRCSNNIKLEKERGSFGVEFMHLFLFLINAFFDALCEL